MTLKHAYYASVSYIDTQIGKITDELERLGMRENTIVVFISDHGWHLGEQGMWGKTTNFENATRAPLIISMPNSTAKGEKTKALVEYVDIFPTLIEATGVSNVIPEYLEGTSMIQLMNSPRKKWKSAAFSQFPRGTNSEKEGYSVRTENFRYTEWWNNEEDKLMDIELYDHINDPLESINVGGEVKYKNTIKEMHEILEKGWKGALPYGFTNNSDNGYAPRSVALGKEGSNRRKQWRKYLDRMKKQGKEPLLIYERY
ncbi:sulfatase-like hydrolase/transferase [Flavobacteriaceae bacterium]|nr:sulfatase-like hydrolase/transferase [Flavobacteriaceae bacterium]